MVRYSVILSCKLFWDWMIFSFSSNFIFIILFSFSFFAHNSRYCSKASYNFFVALFELYLSILFKLIFSFLSFTSFSSSLIKSMLFFIFILFTLSLLLFIFVLLILFINFFSDSLKLNSLLILVFDKRYKLFFWLLLFLLFFIFELLLFPLLFWYFVNNFFKWLFVLFNIFISFCNFCNSWFNASFFDLIWCATL